MQGVKPIAANIHRGNLQNINIIGCPVHLLFSLDFQEVMGQWPQSTPPGGPHLPRPKVCLRPGLEAGGWLHGTRSRGEARPHLTTSLYVRRPSLSSSSVRSLWSWLWIWKVAVRKVFVTVYNQELM